MLFHVEIVVKIPHDVDSEKIKALSVAEVERAKTLQGGGKWLHMAHRGETGQHQRFNVKDGAEPYIVAVDDMPRTCSGPGEKTCARKAAVHS